MEIESHFSLGGTMFYWLSLCENTPLYEKGIKQLINRTMETTSLTAAAYSQLLSLTAAAYSFINSKINFFCFVIANVRAFGNRTRTVMQCN